MMSVNRQRSTLVVDNLASNSLVVATVQSVDAHTKLHAGWFLMQSVAPSGFSSLQAIVAGRRRGTAAAVGFFNNPPRSQHPRLLDNPALSLAAAPKPSSVKARGTRDDTGCRRPIPQVGSAPVTMNII